MHGKIERLKFSASVWGMMAVAAFASSIFEKGGMLGIVIGLFSLYMGIRAVNYRVQLEKEDRQ